MRAPVRPCAGQVRNVFNMLDVDADGIVLKSDLLRSLGGEVSEDEIDEMFKQLGCTSGKLFFTDLLRLMTDQRGRRVAGITSVAPPTRNSTRSSRSTSLTSAPRPTLSTLGKSSTMSAVTLQSEADAANANPLNVRNTWHSKGRSVQNLSRFLAAASSGARNSHGEPDGPVVPSEPSRPRRMSATMDGGVLVPTMPVVPDQRNMDSI